VRGAAYLYENGLQLPEIFRDVLAALYGKPSERQDLHEVIRTRGEFKETAILARWGSWGEFSDDILAALKYAGLAVEEDGKLALTSRAVPGKRLTVLSHPDDLKRRVRTSFHGEQEADAREALADARIKAGEFVSFLTGIRDVHPVIEGSRGRAQDIVRILSQALADAPDRKLDTGGQSEWYRNWVRTADWHSTDDARKAWNEGHPAKFVDTAAHCGFRTVQRTMVGDGLMETRSAVRKDGKGGGREYRWTGN